MMAGMEIDSPSPEEKSPLMSPRDGIVQRLALCGVPHEALEQSQMGLVSFLKGSNLEILAIVSSILPTNKDVSALGMSYKAEHVRDSSSDNIDHLFGESMLWIQWLMFGCEPSGSLKTLAQKASGQRAVCGAVWGQNDLAYRCRTCEHDPTCAICVPCFLNGNHKDHDYSIMYTGGGCCDCGDVTAWKREGFCSQHRGIEQIEPLPEGLTNSIGPVLDALLLLWKDFLVSAEHSISAGDHTQIAEMLSSSVVNMLLEFCRCSESLLSFISRRMFECVDLLDVLVRAELFFGETVVKKLHELLLKLLGEPLFKYEFAKVFTRYYPVIVNEIIKSDDTILETYPLLSTFSVQIFTVPTLTPRLVREVNLLGVLFGCLMDLFRSCVGEDHHLQMSKWTKHYESTIRMVGDIRYVLSHDEVPIYVAYERPDISITWLELLTLVQGMDAQKRVTGSPMDEENEHLSSPFVLGHFLGNVNNLLVQGALSVVEAKGKNAASFCYSNSQNLDGSEDQRHSKVGKTLQGSSVCSISSRSSQLDCVSHYSNVKSDAMTYLCIPQPAIWLITECLKAIDGLLFSESALESNAFSFGATRNSHNMLSFRKKILKIIKGTQDNKLHKTSSKMQGKEELPPSIHYERIDPVGSNIYNEYTSLSDMSVDSPVEVDSGLASEVFSVLSTVDWPDIAYDVSSQEISFHIPLHRLLSLVLRKAMKTCCDETEKMTKTNQSSLPLSARGHEFFGKLLGQLHPYGFPAFLMEHPLRLRVFCAQVNAGMWRRNGDGAIVSSELYRSVQWFKQGLESDLFLLQCCASLAPPELFVKRIQERFGLSNFTILKLLEHNEYDAVLVHEMLTLIIQIVVERRFSGLSTSDSLKRELIYRLSIGDVTHSQLVKSLPRDLSKSEELQSLIDMVAVYSDPSRMKQGRYSLRKTYWRELDLYHPRWSSRDLQVAEERYFKFCKTSARNTQLPRWSDVYGPLRSISHIATSLAVSQIVCAVFYYASFSEVSSVSRIPDGILITSLHIVSLALDICGSQSHNKDTHLDSHISSSRPDNSCMMDLQSHAKKLAPILTCATEEFNIPARDESDLCRKQSMLSLLVILMRKHKEDNDNDTCYAETTHCNISLLIEDLLKKFAELNSECLTTIQHLAPEVVSGMLQQSLSLNAHSSASTSDSRERKAKARERQAAMMAKMRAEQSKFIASLNSTPENEEDASVSKEEESKEDHDPESVPVCSLCRDPHSQSALCFLVLLQKSRLTTFIERGPRSWENGGSSSVEKHSSQNEVSNDSSNADPNNPMQSVRDAGVELSFDVEPAEVNAFLGYLKEHLPDIRNIKLFNASADTRADILLPLEMIEDEVYHSVRDLNDANQTTALDSKQKHLTHVEAEPKRSLNMVSSVLGEYIACLSRDTKKIRSSSTRHIRNLTSRSVMPNIRFGVFGPGDCDGIHISSCGHAVHQECHERYLLSLKQRYIRRLGFEGAHIVDPDMGELLCPVCRRFANSILPAYPGILNKVWMRTPLMSPQTPSSFPSSSCSTDAKTLLLSTALLLIQNTGKMVGQGRILKAFSGKVNERTNPALEPCLQKLYMLYYPRSYNTLASPGRLSKSLVLWDVLRYSIISTEIAARGRLNRHTFSSKSCLESLYAELHSSSGYILSVLLHIAQSARSFNRLEVLSRFRGLQLLAGSICSGVSCHNLSNPEKRKGMLSSLTEKTEDGEVFPDIQFWELAGSPVLAQDPFSSLLWVLFCLPHRFISSNEVFIALVHLFYVVCVVQAMITCYSNQSFDASNFGVCLLGDLCKSMSESELVKRFFVSNYVDSFCHPKDMIRRLTFPYLRRCAILWKLLNYSTAAPLYDGSYALEGSYISLGHDGIDNSDHLKIELNAIQELESIFGICSLDMILKDETVHVSSVRWCNHFFEEFRVCKYTNILSSTPAVPFKLLKLPNLYQDLLQRYVKLKCLFCKLVPEEPALCLLCGQLCSANWKSCCRRSRCLIHATTCGAGIGIFLLVRKTTILLQRFTRQTFWPSPYLDAFGEEDHDMNRGKPLYLSEERYAALTYMMASHGLDRSSEVLRQTTISFTGFD